MEFGFREFEPHPALARYVDRFWARSTGAGSNCGPRLILPDGCIDLIVDVTDGWNASAVGAMTRAREFEPEARSRLIGARFRPGAAVPFLRVAGHRITQPVVGFARPGLGWLPPSAPPRPLQR